VDLAEAIFGPQIDDQCCQLIVTDATAQLAVERVPGEHVTVYHNFSVPASTACEAEPES